MVNILNQFYGGMSRDDVMLAKGEYVYSDGFDITRSPGELRPMPTMIGIDTIGVTATVGSPTFIGKLSDVMVGTSDGKIYDTSGTLLYNTGYSSSIKDIVYFGDATNECFIFLSNRVLRGVLTGTVFSGFSSFYSGTTVTKPVFGFGEMFFGTELNVKRIDNLGNSEDVYSNDKPDNTSMSFLSIQGGYLRVYYNDYSTGSVGGYVDILDIGSLTVSYSVKLPFSPSAGTIADTVDYVYTGTDIYACSGISYRSICEKYYSPLAGIDKFSFQSSGFGMDYANERLYISGGARYMIYGSKHDGLPDVFCYGAYDWLNQAHDTIYAIYANKSNDEVWFGFTDGSGNTKVGYIDHGDYSNSNTVTTATIITPYYNFGDYSTMKQLEEIRVGMTSTGEMDVYASIDGGAFTLVEADVSQSTLGEKIMYYKRDFHEIAIKIVMTGIIQGRKITNIDLRYKPYGI